MEERQLKTGIDRFLDLVSSGKGKRISDAAKELGVPDATVELWADILYQDGFVEIGYDAFGKMVVTPKKEEKKDAGKSPKEASEPVAEGKKIGLLKRFGTLRKKNDKEILKKYAAVKEANVQPKESMFSKLLGGIMKKPAGTTIGIKNEPASLSENPSAPAPQNSVLLRKRAPDDFITLRKRIEELKKMNR